MFHAKCAPNAAPAAIDFEAIDFEAIEGKLGKLEPPKLTLAEVMERLREKLKAQQARGVTVAQLREVLKGYGIELGEKTLRKFLETGELPVKKPVRGKVEAATDGEPFLRRPRLGGGASASRGDTVNPSSMARRTRCSV